MGSCGLTQKTETVTNHILNGDWQYANDDVRITLKQIMQSSEDFMIKRVEHKDVLSLNAQFYKQMTFSDHLEDLAELVIWTDKRGKETTGGSIVDCQSDLGAGWIQ